MVCPGRLLPGHRLHSFILGFGLLDEVADEVGGRASQWQFNGLSSGPVISNFTPPQRQLPRIAVMLISLFRNLRHTRPGHGCVGDRNVVTITGRVSTGVHDILAPEVRQMMQQCVTGQALR